MAVPAETGPLQGMIQAPLKFLVKADQKPVSYRAAPGAPAPQIDGTFQWRSVSIADGRPVADRLSLDGEGFELRPHDTTVPNFYDEEAVRTIYYPEMEQLARIIHGAD